MRTVPRVIVRGSHLRPYAIPGAAELARARFALRLRRRPVVDAAELPEPGEIEERLACLLCGEARVQPLFEPSHGYQVVRCPACGLLYRNPGVRPERLGELYDTGSYARFLTGKYAKRRRRSYRLALDAFGDRFANGQGRRLLDFGCGAGLFLAVAKRRGFEGYGVDLAPDAVEEARRRGLRAWHGAPEDVPEIAAGGFDVVTMWSVLAHLPRPVEDLARLRGLLKPGGVLLVSTVNANSLLLKAYADRWGGFTRNHLVFSSPATLPALLRAAGFADVEVRPSYFDAVELGESGLTERQVARLRRVVDDGNQGPMLRAVATSA